MSGPQKSSIFEGLEGPEAPETTPKGGARRAPSLVVSGASGAELKNRWQIRGRTSFALPSPRSEADCGKHSSEVPARAVYWQCGVLILGGFSADCGPNLIQNFLHNDGASFAVPIAPKISPQINFKAISWQFEILNSPPPMPVSGRSFSVPEVMRVPCGRWRRHRLRMGPRTPVSQDPPG